MTALLLQHFLRREPESGDGNKNAFCCPDDNVTADYTCQKLELTPCFEILVFVFLKTNTNLVWL